MQRFKMLSAKNLQGMVYKEAPKGITADHQPMISSDILSFPNLIYFFLLQHNFEYIYVLVLVLYKLVVHKTFEYKNRNKAAG